MPNSFIEFEKSEYGHVMVNLDHVRYFSVKRDDTTAVKLDDDNGSFKTGMSRKDLKYVLGRMDRRGLLAKDCPQ